MVVGVLPALASLRVIAPGRLRLTLACLAAPGLAAWCLASPSPAIAAPAPTPSVTTTNAQSPAATPSAPPPSSVPASPAAAAPPSATSSAAPAADGWEATAWSNFSATGRLTSTPSVSSWGAGRLDLFGRGQNGALWHRAYDDTSGWHAWESLGQAPAGGPASVSWGPSPVDAFVPGRDNGLWHLP